MTFLDDLKVLIDYVNGKHPDVLGGEELILFMCRIKQLCPEFVIPNCTPFDKRDPYMQLSGYCFYGEDWRVTVNTDGIICDQYDDSDVPVRKYANADELWADPDLANEIRTLEVPVHL